jgi:hypothetical protein
VKYPILHDPGSIELLLRTVCKTTPPKIVDHDYLLGLGFKRDVDEGLLKLLAFLGFIDEYGQPTVLWEKSLDPQQAPVLLGKSIRAAYSTLFNEFPDADSREGTVLMDFFRSSSGASDPDAAYMILTFKVLCDLAGFSEGGSAPAPEKPVSIPPEPVKKIKPKTVTPAKVDSIPDIRISINIDLDDRSDPELRTLAMKLLKKQLEL